MEDNKEKILLADDVEELAKSIGKILKNHNYDVDIAFDGLEVMKMVKENKYDCIILDIMMPNMNGIEAVKEIRNLRVNTPIIMLTARDLVEDKVYGLDIGANDYLTKPFEKDELLARIRVQTRMNNEREEKYRIGNIIFNKKSLEISKDSVILNLNEKEAQVLDFLVKNQKCQASKEEISQKIWNGEDYEKIPLYVEFIQEKLIALNANIRINEDNGYRLDNIYNVNL
ncbi:MAG: response regulator transcription factor [Clostridia bacterium]|nr:response regulator transcription factor [Clostridia bacterium]